MKAKATKPTEIAILVLIVAGCAIPFLSQPFHMDDNFYMDMARNAQKNPLFPNDTPYTFQGEFVSDMGSHSHPPLQTYFLAALLHFFGEGPGKEWIYHLFALLYPILAVLSFYFIAARFVARPLWPSMVLACCPLFLVMQHTLMADIPMLAFWLGASASFMWAVQLRRTGLYAASALFQAAAVFASYQSLALTPLLGFYQFRKGQDRKGWVSLMVAPAAIAVWYTLNCFHYRRMLFGVTLSYIQTRSPHALSVLGTKLLSILEFQGWLVIFPLLVLYAFARGLQWRALILALLAAVFMAQVAIPEYRLVDKGIFVLGLTTGFFILLEMGRLAWGAVQRERKPLGFESAEAQFIGLWYFGVLLYCMFLLPDSSARYLLPLVPPFLICFFRILEISEITEYRLPARFLSSAMVASGSLVLSLIWGLALSRADQEFAGIYPRAASQFSRIADTMESYCIGEWGFRYYMGQKGAQPLPRDESLVHGGSFIAIPKLALPHEIPADLNSMTIPVQTLSYRPHTPLRVFDWQTPAGFYSIGWGLIPFSFSQRALEEIEIRQVSFMVERLPWARRESDTGVSPWPGYMPLQGQSPLAIVAKPGSSLLYPMPVRREMQLQLLCGISPDSYKEGSDASYDFVIRQLDPDGRTLAESRLTLQPGIKKEDRIWQPVQLILKQAPKGTLDFHYSCAGCEYAGTGAFAQSILTPVH